ncbi:MAG: hypothetical protein R3Y40_04585 [Eubacteriales bacterium]
MSVIGVIVSGISVGFFKLSALVGIGTIIIASCMGPLIAFLIKHVAQPFFDR